MPPQLDPAILERISDGVLILDRDWRIAFINLGGATLLGNTLANLQGELYWEKFPQGVGRIFDTEFRRAMERQQPHEFDGYSPSLGRWYRVRTFPSPDSLMLIFHDVTQRYDADSSMRALLAQLQRQRRLATVLAETNEAVFRATSVEELFATATSIAVGHGGFVMAWIGVLDPTTGALKLIAHAGEGADEYLRTGFITTRDEPHGSGVGGEALRRNEDLVCNDILSDASMAPWRDAAARVGYRSSGAFPLRLDNEVCGLLSVYAHEPSYFNDDERNLVHHLAANVSFGWEAIQREEDLRESDVVQRTAQRLRAIIAASPNVMLGLDSEGRIEMASERVEDFFGYRPEEIIGRSIGSLISVAAPETSSLEWFDQLRHSQLPVTSEVMSARRYDGTPFPAEVALSSLFDEPGSVSFVMTVHDLTERLEFEERRRQFALDAQREEHDRLESLGRLASGVAHDFNNLLGVILNFVTLIERQELAEQTRYDIARVRDATERGAALTRQLLTFARSEPTRVEALDITHATRDAAVLLERTLTPGIALRLELSPAPLPVLIDPRQFDQIVVNLVINACDAMPEGGELVVTTAWQPDTELPVVLRVRDTGLGISPEVISRVFEPFFTTKPRGRGSGLGLASVYGIVGRAGGRISIDSEVGKGTTFEILLPVTNGVVSAREVTAPATVPVSREGRVLLVEPDLEFRDATRRILRESGYDVRVASDGREALEVLTDITFDVDVVVSAVVMPNMGGVELAENLERHSHVPVVLLSGYDDTSWPPDRPVLLKPVDEATLLRSLEEARRGR